MGLITEYLPQILDRNIMLGNVGLVGIIEHEAANFYPDWLHGEIVLQLSMTLLAELLLQHLLRLKGAVEDALGAHLRVDRVGVNRNLFGAGGLPEAG